MDLSFNFVDNNRNVNPEYFHNIRDKASYYTELVSVYIIILSKYWVIEIFKCPGVQINYQNNDKTFLGHKMSYHECVSYVVRY